VLAKLTKRLTAAPPNTSRIRLREFAAEAAAQGADKTFRVLDAGAGDLPYADLFAHVSYEACDIKDNGLLDFVCDLAHLPMPDATYDLVFSSQTLEHVRNPRRVMRELARVTKPGGQLWLTAPLFYEEHQKPHDYFRYTRFAWRILARQAGLKVVNISTLEGYYGSLSYYLHAGYRTLPKRERLTRLVLLFLSRRMARREMIDLQRRPGMCKNYRVQLTKPVRT
jgi:SAM-dependent methyltransferase